MAKITTMFHLPILMTILTTFPAAAKNVEPQKIEFCKPTMLRHGQHFTLGHSLFVEGESTDTGKTIFPTKSVFSTPITHVYDFSRDKKSSLWIGCAYNSESAAFIEYIEVKTKPARCVEIMRPEYANQVQSLTCHTKVASP